MKQSISDFSTFEQDYNQKKTSNVIAWIGFSFSLFVLLLLWLTLTVVSQIFSNNTDTHFDGSIGLIMLFLLIGIPIGLVGFILSIIGLVKASNNGGKKWIGISGLIFTGLSIISIFVPMMIGIFAKPQSIQTKLPEGETIHTQHKNRIVLYIDGYQLHCYDNRKETDEDPYQTRLEYPSQIKRELDIWFKMHNIKRNDTIILKVTTETDYSQVADLTDALNELKMKKVQLISNPKNP